MILLLIHILSSCIGSTKTNFIISEDFILFLLRLWFLSSMIFWLTVIKWGCLLIILANDIYRKLRMWLVNGRSWNELGILKIVLPLLKCCLLVFYLTRLICTYWLFWCTILFVLTLSKWITLLNSIINIIILFTIITIWLISSRSNTKRYRGMLLSRGRFLIHRFI